MNHMSCYTGYGQLIVTLILEAKWLGGGVLLQLALLNLYTCIHVRHNRAVPVPVSPLAKVLWRITGSRVETSGAITKMP